MKKLIRMIILSFFTLAVLITASFAWFTNSDFIEPNISGYSVAAYFGGGDGSTNDPFKIKNARHLYNLAWLQYLGYFNKKGSGITENQNATTLTQFSFSIEQNIDMSGWVLPPIGTSYNPFIGKLDGNGYTISNLQTTNRFSDFGQRHPSAVTAQNFANVEMIGFMGAVGTTTTMNHNDCSINTSANELTSLLLNNTTVDTYIPSLLGSVAGYVNGTIEDVGVRLPTLNVNTNAAVEALASKTTNISDYAVVGYAESEYTTALTSRATTIFNPTTTYSHFNYNGMGNQRDWGGSINFANTYQRIYSIVKGVSDSTNRYSTNTTLTHVGKEIQYNKIVDEQVEKDRNSIQINTTTFTNKTNTSMVKYYNYENENGSYLRTCVDPGTNTGDSDQYMTLTALYKDVLIVTKTEDPEYDGFTIKDKKSGYFLNLSATQVTNDITFTTTTAYDDATDNVTVWNDEATTSNGFYIYTYSKYDGYKYYLNASTSNYSTSLSTTRSTVWYKDSSTNSFYTLNGTDRYYLKYYNHSWNITPLYVLKDSTTNNYVKLNGSTIQNTTTASDATAWYFSTQGANPSGTIRAITTAGENSNNYLTITNNLLSVGNSGLYWTNDNTGIYNGSNYIQYKNGYWVANSSVSYKIGSGNNYLSTSLTNTTSDNAALFTIDTNLINDDSGSVTIQLNSLKYLGFTVNNNNLVLSLSDTRVEWLSDGDNNIYCSYDDNIYYLIYDNGWILYCGNKYYISDNSSNYLSISSNQIQKTNVATTLWEFSYSDPLYYPYGTISYYDGNNRYYLSNQGTDLYLSTTDAIEWENDDEQGLYCFIDDEKYNLIYDTTLNEWTLSAASYFISYNDNYLNIDNSGNVISSASNPTSWYFIYSNDAYLIKATANNTEYYLCLDSNGLLNTTTNINDASLFNKDDYNIYDSYNNYLQNYKDVWLLGKGFNIKYGTALLATTNDSNVWFYSGNSDTPSGYIYTISSGVIYYLYTSDFSSLTLSTTDKIYWNHDTNGLYINSSGNKYIVYENGWKLQTLATATAYYIRTGTTYLSADSDGNIVTTQTTPWIFSNPGTNPSGTAYTILPNGEKRYLYDGGTPVEASTNNMTTWYNNGNKLYRSNSNYIRWYNSSQWVANTRSGNGTTLTFDATTVVTSPLATTTDVASNRLYIESNSRGSILNFDTEELDDLSFNEVYKVTIASKKDNELTIANNISLYVYERTEYFGDNAIPSVYSAIPLTTKGDLQQTAPTNYSTNEYYKADITNTGYIISGGHEPRKSADVRISYFNQTGNGYTGMPANLIAGSYSNNKINTVYTVRQKGVSQAITESSSGGINTNNFGFQKYFTSKNALEKTLSSNTKLYGVHFMNAPISKDRYVTMDRVLINGDYYDNYQMPEDCIDFQLASRGYINFFSSYFYYNTSDGGANNCFFSLHEVFRSSNKKITQIRHILKVYENNDGTNDGIKDGTYVYYYEDDSDTSIRGYYYYDVISETYKNGEVDFNFVSSNFTLKFDSDWIEDPANSQEQSGNRQSFYGNNGANNGNKIFYFEIPVNKGEYALGSVSKTAFNQVYNGAYIMYLDIGANAATVDRTTITQESKTVSSDYKYVNGIQIVADTGSITITSIEAANSAVATIPAGGSNLGEFGISRTDNTITFSSDLDSSYIGENITTNVTLTALARNTIVRKVLKYIDYNRSTERTYITTINNDGLNNTDYTVYKVTEAGNSVNVLMDDNNIEHTQQWIQSAEYGLLSIINDSGVPTSSRVDDFSGIAINTKEAQEIFKYDFVVDTANKNNITEEISMNIVRVTGTERINNMTLDSNDQLVVENYYDITNGKITLSEPQYTQTQYILEYVYKLAGDDATVTSQQTAVITVRTAEGTYTFTINGTTVGTGQNDTNTVNTGTYVAP